VASGEGIPRVREVEIRAIADYGGIGVGFLPDQLEVVQPDFFG
jgi:hypothetical protein